MHYKSLNLYQLFMIQMMLFIASLFSGFADALPEAHVANVVVVDKSNSGRNINEVEFRAGREITVHWELTKGFKNGHLIQIQFRLENKIIFQTGNINPRNKEITVRIPEPAPEGTYHIAVAEFDEKEKSIGLTIFDQQNETFNVLPSIHFSNTEISLASGTTTFNEAPEPTFSQGDKVKVEWEKFQTGRKFQIAFVLDENIPGINAKKGDIKYLSVVLEVDSPSHDDFTFDIPKTLPPGRYSVEFYSPRSERNKPLRLGPPQGGKVLFNVAPRTSEFSSPSGYFINTKISSARGSRSNQEGIPTFTQGEQVIVEWENFEENRDFQIGFVFDSRLPDFNYVKAAKGDVEYLSVRLQVDSPQKDDFTFTIPDNLKPGQYSLIFTTALTGRKDATELVPSEKVLFNVVNRADTDKFIYANIRARDREPNESPFVAGEVVDVNWGIIPGSINHETQRIKFQFVFLSASTPFTSDPGKPMFESSILQLDDDNDGYPIRLSKNAPTGYYFLRFIEYDKHSQEVSQTNFHPGKPGYEKFWFKIDNKSRHIRHSSREAWQATKEDVKNLGTDVCRTVGNVGNGLYRVGCDAGSMGLHSGKMVLSFAGGLGKIAWQYGTDVARAVTGVETYQRQQNKRNY